MLEVCRKCARMFRSLGNNTPSQVRLDVDPVTQIHSKRFQYVLANDCHVLQLQPVDHLSRFSNRPNQSCASSQSRTTNNQQEYNRQPNTKEQKRQRQGMDQQDGRNGTKLFQMGLIRVLPKINKANISEEFFSLTTMSSNCCLYK